jgi:hypothetical protein
MSAKVLLRIALALGAALVVWGALALFRRSHQDDAGGLNLSRLNAKDVSEIALRKLGDSLVLARREGGWTVNGFPASTSAVEAFLATIGDTSQQSEVVSQSSASHQRLGVDSVNARRLTVTAGGKAVLDMWFGIRGPDFEGFYVRPEGSDRAYLLRGHFAEQTAMGVPEWREKQIATVASDSVSKVEVRRGKTRWSLQRKGAGWELSHGPADSTKVARFLGLLGGLRAAGFPEPAEMDSIHFEAPERSLTLLSGSGQTLMSLVFDSTHQGAFWVRSTAGGPVYRLDARIADLATPAESTLKK